MATLKVAKKLVQRAAFTSDNQRKHRWKLEAKLRDWKPQGFVMDKVSKSYSSSSVTRFLCHSKSPGWKLTLPPRGVSWPAWLHLTLQAHTVFLRGTDTLPFWFRLMSCCVFLVLRKKEKHSKLGRGRSHFIHCTNAAGVYGRRQRRWGLFASSGHWEPRCLTAGRGCAVPPTASNAAVGCPLTPGHPDLSFLPSVTP